MSFKFSSFFRVNQDSKTAVADDANFIDGVAIAVGLPFRHQQIGPEVPQK